MAKRVSLLRTGGRFRGSGGAPSTNVSFSEALRDFRLNTEAKLTSVVRQSFHEVVTIAGTPVGGGGRMPVITSFLRNSLVVTVNDPTVPPVRGYGLSEAQKRAAPRADPTWGLKISKIEAGDFMRATWTAYYARIVEYGLRGPPRFFVRGAVEKWDQIVRKNAAEVGQRIFRRSGARVPTRRFRR